MIGQIRRKTTNDQGMLWRFPSSEGIFLIVNVETFERDKDMDDVMVSCLFSGGKLETYSALFVTLYTEEI